MKLPLLAQTIPGEQLLTKALEANPIILILVIVGILALIVLAGVVIALVLARANAQTASVRAESDAEEKEFMRDLFGDLNTSIRSLASTSERSVSQNESTVITLKQIADQQASTSKVNEAAANTLTLLKLSADNTASKVDTIKLTTERIDVTAHAIDGTTTANNAKLEDIEKLLRELTGNLDNMADSVASQTAQAVSKVIAILVQDALRDTENRLQIAIEGVKELKKRDTGPIPAVDINHNEHPPTEIPAQ